MKFKDGQTVIISKNLGKQSGHNPNEYYYSGTLAKVPLGTSARIIEILGDNKLLAITKKGERWYLHPNEISPIEQKADSKTLVRLLSADDVEKVEKAEDNGKENHNPKFNAREEFALWIRQEFPELDEHARREMTYKKLEERKDEIMAAARLAYKHSQKTTKECATGRFASAYWPMKEAFKKENSYLRTYRLHVFVDLIKQVAANLDNDYYGTRVKNTGMRPKQGVQR